ncbi:MAG: hypothetical protein CL799_04350 [Chromatiales bacterium]|nr:hypothetical protein [Chromatiales bacterium]MDP6150448.1 hypothetical protein [Gammaproteobacteria bacterium]HJP03756.1 hypothetical protein [Gammaproteobacteria bacterium]
MPLQQTAQASGNFGASHGIQALKVLVLLSAPGLWKEALRHPNSVVRQIADLAAQQQEAGVARNVPKLFRIWCDRRPNSFNLHTWS